MHTHTTNRHTTPQVPAAPRRYSPIAGVLLTLLVSLGLTFGVAGALKRVETEEIAATFTRDLDDKVGSIDRQIQRNFEVLYSLRTLFTSSAEVTAEHFQRITRDVLARHKHIQALAWVPRIDDVRRAEVESSVQAEVGQFRITERKGDTLVPATPRPYYFPATFIEPLLGNERALGFDMASDPVRRAALDRAGHTGLLSSSVGIGLINQSAGSTGVLSFLPVYKGAARTLQAREQQLVGYVLLALRVDQLVSAAMAQTNVEGFSLALFDRTDIEQLLIDNMQPEQIALAHLPAAVQDLMPVGGRTWTVKARPTHEYVQARRGPMVLLVSGFGSALSVLLALVIGMILRRARIVQGQVELRTEELNQTNIALSRLVRNDALTGIANRRHFEEAFEAEWGRGLRHGHSLGLLLLDVDYFKRYNDHYGHPRGDACLIEVARALEGCVRRPGDLVARIGGEEFALLLPVTREVHGIAQLCRQRVEVLQIPHADSPIGPGVTISIGGGVITPAGHKTPRDFRAEVDHALYAAKKGGRNTVRLVGQDVMIVGAGGDDAQTRSAAPPAVAAHNQKAG